MARRKLPKIVVGHEELVPRLDVIRTELSIPVEFSSAALAEAEKVAAEWKQIARSLPRGEDTWEDDLTRVANPVNAVHERPLHFEWPAVDHLHEAALPEYDATNIPFVTIDPAESRDLDQAIAIADCGKESRHGRYLLNYAIASVPTFVSPGGALDRETWERGTTVYLPDEPTPLHPLTLSHGVASLLPDCVTPACVWSIMLDAAGHVIHSRVDRAVIRSRAKLSYALVDAVWRGQTKLPQGVPANLVSLLERLGNLRLAREAARGGVSARIPEQEIQSDNGTYTLDYRSNRPVEEWNAQMSLLTGIQAARHMRAANIGIMRTLKPATEADLARLHRVAQALGIEWPAGEPYPDIVRELDPAVPPHAAFLLEATTLFRGSGYRSFGVKDTRPLPASASDGIIHGAIAAEYAHVTAPLRRLVDRYGEEICIAHSAHRDVPEWVREALDELPSTMARTSQRASQASRRALAVIQALMMNGHEGSKYGGVVVEANDTQSTVMLSDPAVMGTVNESLTAGTAGTFTLVNVDVDTGSITLAPATS